jgi:hypothetical protein
MLPAAPVAAAVTAFVYAALLATTRIPCGADGTLCRAGACERVRAHLAANLHGQDTAVNLLADAVCDHVDAARPGKPLVASLHGSPGIGKSYFHQLLAQAVYNATGDGSHPAEDEFGNPLERTDPEPSGGTGGLWGAASTSMASMASSMAASASNGGNVVDAVVDSSKVIKGYLPTFMGGDVAPRWNDGGTHNNRAVRHAECPGRDCPAYKVIFGTDYVTQEQEAQGRLLRDSIVEHLSVFPESVVVIEEYDKMGCPARGMLKQLLAKGANGNATFHRSVFVLEANLGFVEINRRVRKGLSNTGQNNNGGGDAELGDSELGVDELTATQRTLRDTVFKRWKDERCEEWSDTHKAVGSVDLFAPFLPLTKKSVAKVIEAHLRERTRAKRRAGELRRLTWSRPDVVDFLVSQVEFEKEHAIEGGKEAGGVLSRWVTRALRRLAQAEDTARKKESQRVAVEEGRLWVDDRGGPPLRDKSVRLEVAKGGRELVASVVD